MPNTKRLIKNLFFLAVLSLTIVFCSVIIFAAEKYLSSEGTHIEISLTPDGNAVVQETWNYYYGGDIITRMGRVYLSGDYSLTDFEVYLDGNELTVLDVPNNEHPIGFAAVYEQEDGSIKVDTYLNALDESHQITIKYVVLNAVTVYNDVADFKWNLTSNDEPTSISEITANIYVPYGTEDGGLLMWAHGPSGGTFYSVADDDGMVSYLELSAADVPDTMAVAVRLAMPTELFSESANTVNEDKLDEIINFESQYEKNTGSKEVEKRLLLGASVPAIIGFLLFIVGAELKKPITYHRLKKMRHKVEVIPQYCRTIPDDLSPAIVKRLVMTYPYESTITDTEADGQFSITLLDLVERGFIKADVSQNSVIFTLNPVDYHELTEYEKDIIDILEATSQGQSSFSLEQINDYFKGNIKWISEKKTAFQTHLDEAWNSLGLEEEQSIKSFSYGKLTLYCLVGSFVLLGILILLNRNSLAFAGNAVFFLEVGILYPVAMFFFDLGAISILSLMKDKLPVLTEQGEKQYAMWQAFARFLDDFTTFDEHGLPDVAEWRRYLVYAVALGRNKKLKKQLEIKYPTAYQTTDNNDYWYNLMQESQILRGMDTAGGFSLSTGDYDGGSGGDFSSDAGGYDSGSGGGDFD